MEEKINAVDILKDQSNIQEIEKYSLGKINWIDDEFYDDWKKIKAHTKNLLNGGEEYNGKLPEWFFLAHSKDEIIGRPQLIESVQKRIPLIKCGVKKIKEKCNSRNKKGERNS